MVRDWRELSVLIAGCGSIGKRHARVLRSLGVADLRACDPVADQRAQLAAETPDVRLYPRYEAALADGPDTVFICTPPEMHVPMAAEAIAAGGHVFTEKPLSDSLSGVDELAAQAAAAGRKVMVGLCFRYHAGLLRAKRLLDEGRIGRLVSIRALMGEHLPEVRPDYRTLFTAQHGGALDLMHEIDLALWFAGQGVRQVKALSGTFSDIGIEAPDVAEILIEFEDRLLASIHLDFFQLPRRRQFELIGTQGTILVEFAKWDECTLSVYGAASHAWAHDTFTTDRDDMFRDEDREFLIAVAEDAPIACDIDEGRRSVEVVLAAQDG